MTSERTWTTVLIEIYYWREHRWKSNEDSEEEEEDEGKESRPKNVDAAMQLVPVLSRWCKPAQCVSTSPGGSITLEWIRDKYRVTCSVLMQAKDREVYVAKYPAHGDPVKRAFPFSTEDSTNHETIAKMLSGFLNDIMEGEQKAEPASAAAPKGQQRTWTSVLIEIYKLRVYRWKSDYYDEDSEEEEDKGKESRLQNVDAAMQLVPVLARWCEPAQCVSSSRGGAIILAWSQTEDRVTCVVRAQSVCVDKYPTHGNPAFRTFPFSVEDSTNHETIAKTLCGFLNDIMEGEQKTKAEESAASKSQQPTRSVKVAFTHLTRAIIDEICALAADHVTFKQFDYEPYKTVCALIERRIEILNRRAGGETIAEPTPDLADLVKQVIGK